MSLFQQYMPSGRGMKCSEPLALFTDRYAPVSTESIHAEIIVVSMKFFNIINSKGDSATIRLEALVDKRINTDPKSVIRVTLFLSKSEFR
jgi:hypothetical protein